MADEIRLTRTQRRVLRMLDANGGTADYLPGSQSLRILGTPGRQTARGPSATITALALHGLVLIGNGGRITITERGRMAHLTGAIAEPQARTGKHGVLASAAAGVMAARNALDEIKGDSPWLPLEIPEAHRVRIARMAVEARELWGELYALAQTQQPQRKEAA